MTSSISRVRRLLSKEASWPKQQAKRSTSYGKVEHSSKDLVGSYLITNFLVDENAGLLAGY